VKLVTYTLQPGGSPRFGFKQGDHIVDVLRAAIWVKQERNRAEFLEIPTSLKRALGQWRQVLPKLQELATLIPQHDLDRCGVGELAVAFREAEVILLPPVPDPPSFRDFYAFEQHVKTARRQRGLDMDELWYRLPVFYYANPTTLYGHGAEIPYPAGTDELDFELEIAVVIAEGGSNIRREDAELVIGGYTIVNDWSARDWQREEMRLNLGPAKGKDFATSVGPYLVTPDELATVREGERFDLAMRAAINGRPVSAGNVRDLHHPFSAMIERASRNTPLRPGEYLGSGTVGTGCILELRPETTGGWLKPGDRVTLTIDKLGTLENRIV
jgi:fumarylacetoacetate (FAA) hydrolase